MLDVIGEMGSVARLELLGNQEFDRRAEKFFALVTEQLRAA